MGRDRAPPLPLPLEEITMRKLSPVDRTSRRELDLRVVQKMNNRSCRFTAHRTPQDAAKGQNPIEDVRDVVVRELSQEMQQKAIEKFVDMEKEKATIEDKSE